MGTWACSSGSKENQGQTITPAKTSAEIPSSPVTGKYKIKSGIIHFETSYGEVKGRKIVYFDDYGAKERVEDYDQEEVLKGYLTSDGKTRYHIRDAEKTAYIADRNGSRGWEMEFTPWERLTLQKDYEKDYKKLDNMTIAGKDCEAVQYRGTNVFAGWKGLTLYHSQKPNIIIKAIKLEEVDVDPNKFTVPEGYTIKESMY